MGFERKQNLLNQRDVHWVKTERNAYVLICKLSLWRRNCENESGLIKKVSGYFTGLKTSVTSTSERKKDRKLTVGSCKSNKSYLNTSLF